LHAEIRLEIALGSDSYKLSAGMLRRVVNFEVRDFVVACLRPKQLRTYSFTMLQDRIISPHLIFNKLESIAYILDLPVNLGINPISNVKDLTFLRGIFESPCLPFGASIDAQVPRLLPSPCAPTGIG